MIGLAPLQPHTRALPVIPHALRLTLASASHAAARTVCAMSRWTNGNLDLCCHPQKSEPHACCLHSSLLRFRAVGDQSGSSCMYRSSPMNESSSGWMPFDEASSTNAIVVAFCNVSRIARPSRALRGNSGTPGYCTALAPRQPLPPNFTSRLSQDQLPAETRRRKRGGETHCRRDRACRHVPCGVTR